jgi:hypothetical protein
MTIHLNRHQKLLLTFQPEEDWIRAGCQSVEVPACSDLHGPHQYGLVTQHEA